MSVNRSVIDSKEEKSQPTIAVVDVGTPAKEKTSKSSAGRWTQLEHNRFTEALRLFGKNWKKVEDYCF